MKYDGPKGTATLRLEVTVPIEEIVRFWTKHEAEMLAAGDEEAREELFAAVLSVSRGKWEIEVLDESMVVERATDGGEHA